MTDPLTDEQLAAMQAREAETRRGPWVLRDANEGDGWPPRQFWVIDNSDEEEFVEIHIGDKDVGEFIAHAREDVPALLAEVTRLRAELERARADALHEGATELDSIADQAEAKVLAHYGGHIGRGSCDLVREAARTLRDLATAPACTCGAEAVHQAGCDR